MARFEKGSEVVEATYASSNYSNELQRLLRSGYTRVADPRCEVPLGGEPINRTLEDALRADPTDIGAPLVYADWLQQQGHPRGALIAVQHQLHANPQDAALLQAEREIIEDAGDALLSKPLLAHFALHRGKHEIALSQNLYDGGTITFDHGFIREALVLLTQRGVDEDLFWELLRHPSARVLARLGVALEARHRHVGHVTALITHGPRPPLRALSLRIKDFAAPVDLSGLDVAYPLLEELELAIPHVRFRELELPRLRRLCVQGELGDIGVMLAARTWSELEVLSVHANPDALAVAFAQPVLPKLRTLELVATDRGLEIARMLARSPSAKHVQVIELPRVKLPSEAITLLVENRARFERLAMLRVDKVRTNELDRLRAAGYPVQTSPAK